jgi:tetratricopeptide (TPR) repeat protein
MLDWLELPDGKQKAGNGAPLREEVRRLRPAEELMLSAERLYYEGEFALAAREFRRVRSHDPSLFAAWAEEVDAWLRAGDAAAADAAATEALDSYGKVPLFYAAKALVLAHQGHVLEAFRFSDISVRHQDASMFTWLSRGEVVLSAAQPGTMASADACFERAYQLDPTRWHAPFRVALVLHRWGYADRALERLAQATEVRRDGPFLWKFRGDCHRQVGHDAGARECYQVALSRRPDYKPALDALRSMTPLGRLRAQLAKLFGAERET